MVLDAVRTTVAPFSSRTCQVSVAPAEAPLTHSEAVYVPAAVLLTQLGESVKEQALAVVPVFWTWPAHLPL